MKKPSSRILALVSLLAVLLLPTLALAAVATFKDFANVIVAALKGVVNILFVSLSVGVAYGVALYFINSDNEQKREQIRGYLLWAVIGLAVVFGLWGLIQILCDTLAWCDAGIPYISPPA
jgi:hypothetical protein